uniref:Uncharacterized protein n=1 Tax=Octactis speculum TaxID=3111310 RepID=A0A7S2HT87_9STRA|mmetsp:Transcript_9143/g.11714  ORF Transcript_9143/g.11714 Transcript_9143/m.11714 type:complete len:269 (+) Transcript_9143:32-838(+)|eukprot:CAMPEP_0185762858 /NCGR_PEP_ID=MMETSP1174-20130828/21820_1 /TAXON_ID=35687 /ORGANISM="Dictyocha speculum, Strain CCMP1381" /LENGTH=268 /DNA_ID=CAMNT_0028444711 /DNA_START=32 /DNA_END=838 /DNA_ORIENTATION=-
MSEVLVSSPDEQSASKNNKIEDLAASAAEQVDEKLFFIGKCWGDTITFSMVVDELSGECLGDGSDGEGLISVIGKKLVDLDGFELQVTNRDGTEPADLILEWDSSRISISGSAEFSKEPVTFACMDKEQIVEFKRNLFALYRKERIFEAAASGTVSVLEKLCSDISYEELFKLKDHRYRDSNGTSCQKWTVVHHAAYKNQMEVIAFLYDLDNTSLDRSLVAITGSNFPRFQSSKKKNMKMVEKHLSTWRWKQESKRSLQSALFSCACK